MSDVDHMTDEEVLIAYRKEMAKRYILQARRILKQLSSQSQT
jgi:hypothetical protein